LINPARKALIVGFGGFVGVGEKDLAVPFNAVKITTKDTKTCLIMNDKQG
jgi:PRC-barrel domain